MKVKLNGNDFYRVTSEYGAMEEGLRTVPHQGLDLAIPEGTPLNSPVDGIITKVADYGDKGLGKSIFIKTDDHKTVIMGHLSDFKVVKGQRVHEGDFVALSGNTGNSTGSHLHLGMKDADGSLINPEGLLTQRENILFQKEGIMIKQKDGVITKAIKDHDKVGAKITEIKEDGFMGNIHNFMDFIKDIKQNGLFHAIYGKSFFEVLKEGIINFFHDLGLFILGNNDLFLLLPAIVFMFATFMIGKNKFTKWIVPLWFAYFVTSVFHKMLL